MPESLTIQNVQLALADVASYFADTPRLGQRYAPRVVYPDFSTISGATLQTFRIQGKLVGTLVNEDFRSLIICDPNWNPAIATPHSSFTRQGRTLKLYNTGLTEGGEVVYARPGFWDGYLTNQVLDHLRLQGKYVGLVPLGDGTHAYLYTSSYDVDVSPCSSLNSQGKALYLLEVPGKVYNDGQVLNQIYAQYWF